jgi:hypothetical protein
VVLFASLGGLLPGQGRARGADVEVREFNVTVDGKPAGEYRMTITRQDDGSVSMACRAEVKVKVLGVTAYSYAYDGVEVWKDARLQTLQSTANDDGKRFRVSAASDGRQLRVTVNGQPKAVRGDVWLTTAWCLPDPRVRNGAVPLMEADDAKEINGQLQPVGSGPINVAGQAITCAHYRLMSSGPHDLWYDAQERMVRQEWVEDGHRTVLELARVRR